MCKKIVLLCGLIGSGKTTYAQNNFKCFTDLDMMPRGSTKKDQVALSINLLKTDDVVCHISCFPTEMEISVLKEYNIEYLWIDSTISQCQENIIRRKRQRDMENLAKVFYENEILYNRMLTTVIPFKKINVWK